MSAFTQGIKSVYRGFAALQRFFLFALMTILTTAMLAQIITRYFFNTSLFGLEQFIGYAAVWLYFIGAAYGTYERSHIKAEFINMIVTKPASRHWIRAFSGAVSVVMAGIFTKWSQDFCLQSIEVGETSPTMGVPMIIFQSALWVGGVLMVLYFAIEAIDHTIMALQGAPYVSDDESAQEEEEALWKPSH